MSHSKSGRIAIPVAAVLASGISTATALGQNADEEFTFAEDYFVVMVAQGIVPTVLPSGLLSFTCEKGCGSTTGGRGHRGVPGGSARHVRRD